MEPRIVIPQGDPVGIGPEVALKALASSAGELGRCLLYGHLEPLRRLARELDLGLALEPVSSPEEGFELAAPGRVPVVELERAPSKVTVDGRPSADCGHAVVESVLRAGTACLQGSADGMVTPPITKRSMHLAGYPFEGQTQIVGELCRSRRYGMLVCNGDLRILPATRHKSLRSAIQGLEINAVMKQLRIAHEAARETLGLAEPRIALAALNPHASEGGIFGNEEKRILMPAIRRFEEETGFETMGPCVPDVVFRDAAAGKYDIVVALYHDQAFIPAKLLGVARAYTLFVGGPILRVSPVHGAALELSGKGIADEGPMANALEVACRFARARSEQEAGSA